MTDIAIIGAGAIGLAVAWRAAQRGAVVHVYDAGLAGHGATWASAGILVAAAGHAPTGSRGDEIADAPLLALCRRGLAQWPAFVAELEAASGMGVGYRTEGTLLVALDDAEAESMRAAATTPWRSADEIAAMEPALAGRVAGGEWHADEHQIDNRRLASALVEAVRRAGGHLHERATASLELGGPRPVIRTTTGSRPFDRVVLAAGAWAGSIAGLPDALRPPTRPVKGQMLALRDPETGPWLRHTVFTRDVYLVPRGDGRLLVGATVEEAGFDDTVTAGGVRELLDGARAIVPALDGAALLETWAGLRPGSPDDAPLLGPLADGVIAACGHYRNGILLTPLTGELIADLALGGPVPEWAAPFAATRFR
jgi:glycine oxidase